MYSQSKLASESKNKVPIQVARCELSPGPDREPESRAVSGAAAGLGSPASSSARISAATPADSNADPLEPQRRASKAQRGQAAGLGKASAAVWGLAGRAARRRGR